MTFRLMLKEDADKYLLRGGGIDIASYRNDRFARWSKLRRNRRVWVERIKALAGSYFWLPCPICGEFRGGQEEPTGSLENPVGAGKMVCGNPRCIVTAFYRSRELYRARGPGNDLLLDDCGEVAWALRELGEELKP